MLKKSLGISKTSPILIGFYLLPPLIVLGYILRFGVNIPVYDQWVLPKLFEKVATNQLNFGDLFELHNNHRILSPRLIFIALAFASDWNIKLEMVFSWGLAVLTFVGLYLLAFPTSSAKLRGLFHPANLLTCWLIFSLNQEWLWGFQLPIFLINFCLILACLILYFTPLNGKIKLPLAATFCFVASFSSAQGLLTWLAVIPLILSGNIPDLSRTKRLFFWLTGFIISAGIYAIGYQQEPRIINLSPGEYLLTAIHFFLNLLAAPLVQIEILSPWVGAVILLAFLGISAHSLKTSYLNSTSGKFALFWGDANTKIEEPLTRVAKNPGDQFLPWLCIGLFSLLTSLLITWGRVEWGGNYPLFATRYTTHTLLLIVALVQLGRVAIESPQKLGNFNKTNGILTFGFCAGILLSLTGVSSQHIINQVRLELPYKSSAETCLNLFDYLEDSEFFKSSPNRCLLPMSKSTWWIRDGVESLNKIGMGSFEKNIPFVSEPAEIYGYIDSPPAAETPLNLKPSDTISIGGWAVLPGQKRQPDLVFLSGGQQNSFFANAQVGGESPDIAEYLNSNRYSSARWRLILSGTSLPTGETAIKAWVYDPEGRQFVRLRGEVNISISGQ